jgi:signal transduction histidine kinase
MNGSELPMGERRATVLVVDDNASNRALLVAWLGGLYDIVQAEDGDSALAKAREREPDLVLLDVMMPGMSGFEACRLLKSLPGTGYLPVLLLTALGEQEERNAGLEAGADDFLAKPVDRRELLLRVRAFERLRRQDQQIRRQLVDLRRLDALKDDLISLVTHDLRNALGGIMLLLETMDGADEGSRANTMGVLQVATSRMRETLDDMLRIKQLEDGVLHVDRSEVRLQEVFARAIATAEPGARARRVSLRQEAEPDASIAGDSVLLQRGIFNLVQNAVKYSPAGATVELVARVGPDEVVVEVLDRGPGVADSVRDSLFEKYGGVETARETGRSGFGLGLYFVQLMARAHGGRVFVAERDGGGSAFRLCLPRVP